MPQIVLSGSMVFLEDMKDYAQRVQRRGFSVFIPEDSPQLPLLFNDFITFKRQVTRRHYDTIAAQETKALFVINNPKNGIPDYLGASTIAEIAMAFYFNKKTFLLNDIYPPFTDELLSWGVTALRGDLNFMFEVLCG